MRKVLVRQEKEEDAASARLVTLLAEGLARFLQGLQERVDLSAAPSVTTDCPKGSRE